MARSLVSPEDQKVTFVELFFDLVFVFAVTQVVGLLHDGLDLLHAGQALLVFWLVWWAWTQFTWALNPADTTHPAIEVATLGATAVAFFMAIAVPDAFGAGALAFAIPYVLGRVIGLVLYARVAAADAAMTAAVRTFGLLSTGGLIAVLAGALMGGTLQYWSWGLAILLDVLAAAVGGQLEGWDLRAEHFAERHGLFVIIALGESLIVAAGGATGASWSRDLSAVSVGAVAVTCALWWIYFVRAKPALDHALEASTGNARSSLGRDAFSLLHFPMVLGIIALAAAIEAAVAHPAEPLAVSMRIGLAAAVVLFAGGMGLAVWRATRNVLLPRGAIALGTAAALVGVGGVSPAISLAITLAGALTIALVEQRAWPAAHA